MNTCPCCGQAVPPTLPKVDLSRNTVVIDNTMVYLTELEAALLGVLSKEWPKVVPRKQLLTALYGKTVDVSNQNKLDSVTTRLRRKIAGYSWQLYPVVNRGLTLKYRQERAYELQRRGPEVSHV